MNSQRPKKCNFLVEKFLNELYLRGQAFRFRSQGNERFFPAIVETVPLGCTHQKLLTHLPHILCITNHTVKRHQHDVREASYIFHVFWWNPHHPTPLRSFIDFHQKETIAVCIYYLLIFMK